MTPNAHEVRRRHCAETGSNGECVTPRCGATNPKQQGTNKGAPTNESHALARLATPPPPLSTDNRAPQQKQRQTGKAHIPCV